MAEDCAESFGRVKRERALDSGLDLALCRPIIAASFSQRSKMKPFRTMFYLRPIEWIPVVLGLVIGLAPNLYVTFSVFDTLQTGPVASSSFISGPVRMLCPTNGFGVVLVLLGFGCWLWRLNRWVKEK
jgi:hypothetical protein